MRIFYLYLLLLAMPAVLHAQQKAGGKPGAAIGCCTCDVVYTFVDKMPQYRSGDMDILTFLGREVIPLYATYQKKEDILITKVFYNCVVGKTGKVLSVEIVRPHTNAATDSAVVKKIRTMKWQPGKLNGKLVCVSCPLVINCILPAE